MHLDQSFAACKSEATKSARNELRNTKIFVVKQKPHKTEKDGVMLAHCEEPSGHLDQE